MLSRDLRLWAAVFFSLLPALSPALAKDKTNKKDEIKEEKPKWDVAHPSKHTYTITIDTEEGTWISVDVSPDGKELVFDLLGDLYLLPIQGGEAQPLTSGLVWDMHPRFSPDGKEIAFTSDRGGGDNIWTIQKDGNAARQISDESFRLLNNPVWSPDGAYIAARKHFTSARSLGSGEIWLYHKAGGKGFQLNKKPNEQKDLGEPAFSADGRYVYFSQDTTSGGVFQYSKDPGPGIYSINRIDRVKGEVETVLSGPGGAIRPTPSPDGRWLAFIRRQDYDTVLFIHDLESGRNIPIYRKLDRDMQETWAVHGVYAGISWTPDSRELVFWAGGKLHRVDIETKTARNIPFHVKTEHTMVKHLRHEVAVAPDTFEVKMLRWPRVSPDGKRVVYQALGYLYVKDLPEGKPHRLTRQKDHFEFYPSLSRDGKWLVYTTWNDVSFGSLRIIPAAGGTSRVINDKPGHFIEPVFSPDGKTIVYGKSQGGFLRTPLWSKNPGLYAVSTEGGKATRITKVGSQPHFGDSNERLFYVDIGEKAKRNLKSVNLQGFEERTHLESKMGGEFNISPDGRWLAFTEGYNAYIMPFTFTGKTVKIGPKAKDVPVRMVSKEAGEYLHWESDSSGLYWSLGDRLYHRELADSFDFLPGAPEKLPEPEAMGTAMGFRQKTHKPEGLVALTGVRIVSMKGDQVIENGTILVEGNRIRAVGKSGRVTVPADAFTMDLSGRTVIPGIIDVHAHGPHGTQEIIPQQNWRHYAGLAFGVTTIHDPSNDTSTIFASSEMEKAGLILAPRTFSTGTILYGATVPLFTAKIENAEDAAFHLRRLKAVGAFSVKSYNQPRREQRQQVIEAARELNIMVVPEGGSLFQHNMTMIADGHTGIEHSLPVADAYNDVLQFWSQSKTYYTPTLGVAYGGISGENYWYQHGDVWKHPRLTQFVPGYILRPRAKRRVKSPEREYNHIRVARLCKKLLDAGVNVQLGAHGQREGLAAHWEIWMFTQGGMTPLEALRAATLHGAQYLGMDKDLGSIEKGKLADLVILEKNPLENIYHSDSVSHVMLNGRLFDGSTMDEIGNTAQKRKPFFWEADGAAAPATHVHVDAAATCGGFCRH